jgi:hypothetical protein
MRRKIFFGIIGALLALAMLIPAIAPSAQAEVFEETVSTQEDVLYGWTMYFVDFEQGKDFKIKVTQREPADGGEFASATGFGHFAVKGVEGAGDIEGYLFVKEASWSNWNEEQGYPESAIVTGYARIGFLGWVPFTVVLTSNEWPGSVTLDEATLTIDEEECTFYFQGELHHSRIRAYV